MTKKTTERIKSVILVVLFLTTILLLYLIWGGTGQGKVDISEIIPTPNRKEEQISAKEILCPDEVIYSTGDGGFVRIAAVKESYDAYTGLFTEICNQGSAMVTEITEEQYREAAEKYESTQLNFSFSIPFSEYCELYGINRSSSFANVSCISRITFSSAAPDSILLADESVYKYYRVVGENQNAEFQDLTVRGRGDINCYDVKTILGAGGGSLFPIQANADILEAGYKPVYDGTEETRTEIARNVFRDNFSFVRRISDSFDNYTFMYGYGQKSLTLYASGEISYKEEIQNGESKGFIGDLETAVNFADSIIGFKSKSFRYAIMSAYQQGGKSATNIYEFKQCTNNNYEIGNPNYALIIVVEKGQVSEFRCNAVIPDERYMASYYTEAANPANAVAAAVFDTSALEDMARSLISMTPALLIEEDKLVPVWNFKMHDIGSLHYNLYSGEFKY